MIQANSNNSMQYVFVNRCWINYQDGFLWTFAGPVLFVLCVCKLYTCINITRKY